jgi:hypothetical protein
MNGSYLLSPKKYTTAPYKSWEKISSNCLLRVSKEAQFCAGSRPYMYTVQEAGGLGGGGGVLVDGNVRETNWTEV